jgi:hypothetical protein
MDKTICPFAWCNTFKQGAIHCYADGKYPCELHVFCFNFFNSVKASASLGDIIRVFGGLRIEAIQLRPVGPHSRRNLDSFSSASSRELPRVGRWTRPAPARCEGYDHSSPDRSMAFRHAPESFLGRGGGVLVRKHPVCPGDRSSEWLDGRRFQAVGFERGFE